MGPQLREGLIKRSKLLDFEFIVEFYKIHLKKDRDQNFDFKAENTSCKLFSDPRIPLYFFIIFFVQTNFSNLLNKKKMNFSTLFVIVIDHDVTSRVDTHPTNKGGNGSVCERHE